MKATKRAAASKKAPNRNGANKSAAQPRPDALHALLRAVAASGGVDIVDLTQTLSPEFPPIVLPPEMGQSRPFRMEEISRYDERGPAWYWNNVSFGEHTGTHFDAPIHWISGRDRPNNTTDTLSVEHFIAPACVIDCSAEAERDADFLLTAAHLKAWEKRHGRIPPRSWVLMRTDWSKRSDPVAYRKSRRDRSAHARPRSRLRSFPGGRARRARVRHRNDRHRRRAGGALFAALSVPLLHAWCGQIRLAVFMQSRSLAADRRAYRRRTAENPPG